MAGGGRRYPLLIYRAVINRWWPATLFLTFVLAVTAWPIRNLDPFAPWRWQGLLGLAGIALVFTALLFVLRANAYVQAFPTHLRLVTPFLRFNISFKRLRRYTTTELRSLFPPNRLSGSKREIIAPLGGKTAIVLELNGWPASPGLLRIFLSPFFFKPRDTTPHFIILVDDWMRFSIEVESKRTGPREAEAAAPRPMDRSILGKLPRRDQ